MAGIAIDQMQKHKDSKLKGYESIWFHILEFKDAEFTIKDINLQTSIHESTVRDYLKRLIRAGYVQKLEGNKGSRGGNLKNIYIVIKPVLTAPRLTRNGTPAKSATGRDNMWRTMKMIGRFTKHDLAIYSSTDQCQVKVSTAGDYIKHMSKAGYIVEVSKKKGNVASQYVFLQSKNTGPKAPMIQRVKNVYDPNIKEIVWTNGDAS